MTASVRPGDARVVAVIQARMGSSRLPGKVLRALGGRAVLGWVVRAAQLAAGVDEVVVATSRAAEDDAIEDFARAAGVAVVRGSEDDVLDRYVAAAAAHQADAVVRLTSDCPLLDPAVIGGVVALWRADPALEYVATTLVRTLPRGLDVELVAVPALRRAWAEATGHHRSHVTSWLYRAESLVPRGGAVFAPDASRLRVTLDEQADAELLDAVVDALGDRVIPVRELVSFLQSRPDIVAINRHVEQKALEQG